MAEQRYALVTGANKGLGFEIARRLAGQGFQVLVGARRPEAGEEACKRLRQAGLLATFLPLDVSNLESIAAAAKEVSTRTDRLEVLVNNAGMLADEDKSALEVSPDLVLRTFQTNTLGALWLAQKLWPLLARSQNGRIINMSSGLGALHDMGGGYPAYRISKTALNAVTSMLAAELAPQGIAVNSVCPGWVRTDMGGPSATRSVEEGADTAVWLATEAPPSLTGKFLRDRRVIPW